MLRKFSVTLESNDNGYTEPVDAMDVEAANAKEAARVAARAWSLKPYQWCFSHSPFLISASEVPW